MNIQGDMVGNIEDIFFKDIKKDSIHSTSQTATPDIKEEVSHLAKQYEKENTSIPNGNTIIHINNNLEDLEDIKEFKLTLLEEKRLQTFIHRGKEFIDIETGEEVKIVEKTEMYNGAHLYTVKHQNDKLITYPRTMFIGSKKRFVPKIYYIREAERALEDSIDKFKIEIHRILSDNDNLIETPDGKYLELILDPPLNIVGGFVVPDKIQIPVKRLFDLEYKILMLDAIICLDNKIASLLFIDYWF